MAYCAHALMADLPNATHDCGNSSAYRRVVESFLSDTTVRWCDQTRLLLDQHWAAVQAADWRFNATFVTELLAAARALPETRLWESCSGNRDYFKTVFQDFCALR
eukprot:EG_transcript_27187